MQRGSNFIMLLINKGDIEMTKYELLTKDISQAIYEAKAIAKVTNEKGTCNCDFAIVHLPRWNHKKVYEAVERAGTTALYFDDWKGFAIVNPVSGQGNRRTEQAETIYEVMQDLGYNVSFYCQTD